MIEKSMSQQPAPTEKSYLKKYKRPILVSIVIVVVAIVLVSPIIPSQYTVAKTRTRTLQYISQAYSEIVYGIDTGPCFINVTNKDSIGGNFSVTMKWFGYPNPLTGKYQLLGTFSQSLYIDARTTKTFYVPEGWFFYPPAAFSFTYSVSAPSIQESYQVTKTEYKSILSLLEGVIFVGQSIDLVTVASTICVVLLLCLAILYVQKREKSRKVGLSTANFSASGL